MGNIKTLQLSDEHKEKANSERRQDKNVPERQYKPERQYNPERQYK